MLSGVRLPGDGRGLLLPPLPPYPFDRRVHLPLASLIRDARAGMHHGQVRVASSA